MTRYTRTLRHKAVQVNTNILKDLNRRTAINAERCVFASQIREGIGKLIKKYSFTRKQPRLDKDEMIQSIRKRAMDRKSDLPD